MPKLDVSGANWALFVLYFQMVVQEKELWGHFDSSIPCPVSSPSIQSSLIPISFNITTPAITQEAIDIACSLLVQQHSDSTLIVSYVKIGRSSFE